MDKETRNDLIKWAEIIKNDMERFVILLQHIDEGSQLFPTPVSENVTHQVRIEKTPPKPTIKKQGTQNLPMHRTKYGQPVQPESAEEQEEVLEQETEEEQTEEEYYNQICMHGARRMQCTVCMSAHALQQDEPAPEEIPPLDQPIQKPIVPKQKPRGLVKPHIMTSTPEESINPLKRVKNFFSGTEE